MTQEANDLSVQLPETATKTEEQLQIIYYGWKFAELKRQVAAGQGLDAAIHAVKPAADASAEATRAKEQAQRDMRAPGD